MDINEVYAQNIQPRQIVERIKCDPTDLKAIEYERSNFLKFLRNMEEYRRFSSQQDAWEVYDNSEPFFVYDEEDEEFLDTYEVESFTDRKLKEIEQEEWLDQKTPDWVARLQHKAYNIAINNAGNYNEYGGQE